jgi:hypothetical protein
MATLTNSTAFTIAAGSTVVAQTDVEVVSTAVAGQGRGRLIHPTLGTFDYPYMPEQWTNVDGAAIVPPTWQTTRTLGSGQATLWAGNVRDVEATETWTAPGGLSMPMTMLRMLLSIYQNPPDPATDYLQWFPNYVTTVGYDVVMKNITVGGQSITFTDTSLQGWCDLPVTIVYQLVQSAQ